MKDVEYLLILSCSVARRWAFRNMEREVNLHANSMSGSMWIKVRTPPSSPRQQNEMESKAQKTLHRCKEISTKVCWQRGRLSPMSQTELV